MKEQFKGTNLFFNAVRTLADESFGMAVLTPTPENLCQFINCGLEEEDRNFWRVSPIFSNVQLPENMALVAYLSEDGASRSFSSLLTNGKLAYFTSWKYIFFTKHRET